jgi:hypothetical protein
VVSGAPVDRAVVAAQLDSIALLEAVVEILEQVVEGRCGLVRSLGEDGRIGLVSHQRGPAARRGAFGACWTIIRVRTWSSGSRICSKNPSGIDSELCDGLDVWRPWIDRHFDRKAANARLRQR